MKTSLPYATDRKEEYVWGKQHRSHISKYQRYRQRHVLEDTIHFQTSHTALSFLKNRITILLKTLILKRKHLLYVGIQHVKYVFILVKKQGKNSNARKEGRGLSESPG